MTPEGLEEKRREVLDYLYDWYKEHRGNINKAAGESELQIDKLIMTVASGAIILSITFYKDFIAVMTPCIITLLKASWVLFLLSIISVITSYKFSISSFKKAQEKLDDWYRNLDEKLREGTLDFPVLKNRLLTIAIILNYISYSALVLGLMSSVAYAFLAI